MKKLKFLFLSLVLLLAFTNTQAQKKSDQTVELKVELPSMDSLKSMTKNEVSKLTNAVAGKVNTFHSDSLLNDIRGLVPDTTLPFYKEVYGDLKAGAIAIANGLGVAIKELFEILCIQQIVKSVVLLLYLIISVLLVMWCRNLYKVAMFDDMNGHGLLFLLVGSISLFLFFYSIYHMTDLITGFINPKFGAIKDISDMASDIKNGKGISN